MAASGQPAPHVDYEGEALGLTRPILLNFPVGTRCAIGTGATGGCGAVVAAQGVARSAGTARGGISAGVRMGNYPTQDAAPSA